VVPDLVVLLVFEGDLIYPLQFFWNGGLQGEESRGAIEPDGVVGGVEGDDVFGESEDAGAVFFCCHYCAEIAHCCTHMLDLDRDVTKGWGKQTFGVFVSVCYLSQCSLSIILRYGHHIIPLRTPFI